MWPSLLIIFFTLKNYEFNRVWLSFVDDKEHRNNVDNWIEREEGEDASDDQDNNGTDKENNDNMIMEDDQQDVEGEDAVTTDDDDVINNTRNAVARSEEIWKEIYWSRKRSTRVRACLFL